MYAIRLYYKKFNFYITMNSNEKPTERDQIGMKKT